MTQATLAVVKIPTDSPQRARGAALRRAPGQVRSRGAGRPATEENLAAKLEKVRTRLKADAPNMRRPGADLIAHYLDPDRLPVSARWSRKEPREQVRL